MNYVNQSCNDLFYTVISGPIDLKQFNTIKEEKGLFNIKGHEISVLARIIGESHLINFKIDGKEFTEILSCLSPNIEAGCCQKKSQGKKDFRFIFFDFDVDKKRPCYFGRCYNMKNNRNVIKEFESEFKSNSLVVAASFPSKGFQPTPFTIISVKSKEREGILEFNSVHTYPNENVMVRHNSKILF